MIDGGVVDRVGLPNRDAVEIPALHGIQVFQRDFVSGSDLAFLDIDSIASLQEGAEFSS